MKHTMVRRCVAFILAFVMVASLCYIPAFAEECKHENVTKGETVPPSCKEFGYGYTYAQCNDCGEKLTVDWVDPLKEHVNVVADAGKAPTCTESGLTDGSHCTVCNEVVTPQTTIPAPGHTVEKIPAQGPSCTEPGKTEGEKCSVCGEILKAPQDDAATGHTHVALRKEAYQAPTCDEPGFVTYKCSCGNSYTVDIPALEHEMKKVSDATCNAAEVWGCENCDYTEPKGTSLHGALVWTTKTPATCYVSAVEEATCPVCGKLTRGGEEFDAPHHQYVATPFEDAFTPAELAAAQVGDIKHGYVIVRKPTCTHPGLYAKVCQAKDCGAYDNALHEYGDTQDQHIGYVEHAEVPATCTADGTEAWEECTTCGWKSVATPVVIPATGHSMSVTTAPTCSAKGEKTCSVCGATEPVAINPTAHNYKDQEVVADCQTVGKTWEECEYCGDKKNEVVGEKDPNKHVASEDRMTAKIPATCTKDGVASYVCLCGVGFNVTLPATGHHAYADADLEENVNFRVHKPTCVADGYTEYLCKDCGAWFVDPSKNTSKNDFVSVENNELDLPNYHVWGTAKDYKELVSKHQVAKTWAYECALCHAQDAVYEISTTNCDPVLKAPKVPATCTTDGTEAVYECSICGALTGGEVIPAGHDEEILPEVQPDCVNGGLTEGKKCKVCGEVLVPQTPLSANGHSEQTLPAVAPDCVNTGLTEGKKCSVCGVITVAQTLVKANGHTPSTNFTCEGNVVCTVAGCGVVIAPETGHDYQNVAGQKFTADCDEIGFTLQECSICGDKQAVEFEDKKGHTPVKVPGYAASCGATGLTDGSECGVCGVELVKQETVPALPHVNKFGQEFGYEGDCVLGAGKDNHDEYYFCVNGCGQEAPFHKGGTTLIKDADCVTPKHSYTVCNACGDDKWDVTVLGHALGHNMVSTTVPAKCEVDGSITTACSRCKIAGETTVLPAIGHKWDDGVVTTKPTSTSEGVKTFTCQNDAKHTKTEVVPATGALALSMNVTNNETGKTVFANTSIVAVEVKLESFTDNTFKGAEFVLAYNDAVLNFTGFSAGDFKEAALVVTNPSAATGTVTVTVASFAAELTAKDSTVVTLYFEVDNVFSSNEQDVLSTTAEFSFANAKVTSTAGTAVAVDAETPETITVLKLGDLCNDGVLDIFDVQKLAALAQSHAYDVVADINQDGRVNLVDFMVLQELIVGNGSYADIDELAAKYQG